jgi:hypothetical protein
MAPGELVREEVAGETRQVDADGDHAALLILFEQAMVNRERGVASSRQTTPTEWSKTVLGWSKQSPRKV